jgi:hypothetical protein
MQSDLGSSQCETYVLEMSYNANALTDAQIGTGNAGIAAIDNSGNWSNAVSCNFGGKVNFVVGAWKSGYGLGSYGVDTANNVAWAVINFGGRFAVVNEL